MFIGSFIGLRAFIKNEAGKNLASASIIEHNQDTMTITIDKVLPEAELNHFVTVLILENKTLHEYSGKIRRNIFNTLATDIALAKGKIIENRKSRRYIVNTSALVTSLIFDNKLAPMLNPMQVFVVNLSFSGALLKALPNSFTVGAFFELKIEMAGSLTTICAQIVWIKNIDKSSSHYGCKFTAVN